MDREHCFLSVCGVSHSWLHIYLEQISCLMAPCWINVCRITTVLCFPGSENRRPRHWEGGGQRPWLSRWQLGGGAAEGGHVMEAPHTQGEKRPLKPSLLFQGKGSLWNTVSVEGSLLNNSRKLFPQHLGLWWYLRHLLPVRQAPILSLDYKKLIAGPGPHYNKTPGQGRKEISPISNNRVSCKNCVWLHPFLY